MKIIIKVLCILAVSVLTYLYISVGFAFGMSVILISTVFKLTSRFPGVLTVLFLGGALILSVFSNDSLAEVFSRYAFISLASTVFVLSFEFLKFTKDINETNS